MAEIRRWWGLGPLLFLCACSGRVADPLAPETPPAAAEKPSDPAPAELDRCGAATPRRIRRLTQAEHRTAIADLLGKEPTVFAAFPPEAKRHGFAANAELTATGGIVEAFARVAEQAARQLPVERLAPCDDAAGAGAAACATRFARSFGRRAFGRPLADDEVARLGALFDEGREGGRYEDGIRLVAEALLQSPHFLYRTELGPGTDATTGVVRLTAHEIASQLSFLLTGRRPDEALLDAAEAGRLDRPEGIEAEADRLLATPAARAHLRDFLRSWLGLDELDRLSRAPHVFPAFTTALRTEIDLEARRFLDGIVAAGGRLETLLDGPLPAPTPLIAQRVYDADPKAGGPLRRGILGLPGFLAAHAAVDRTSPVERGRIVRMGLFCQDVPPPPPDVVFAPIDADDQGKTTRRKTELHVQDACKGCHQLLDPIGFGLEQLDAIGRHRTEEFGAPVDARGALVATDVDGPFSGPAALGAKLAKSRQVRDCFVTQVYRFAQGGSEGAEDACTLRALQGRFAPPGTTIPELLRAVVTSPSFVLRRSEP